MNLPALYDLLAARTAATGEIILPSWSAIAKAAEVPECDDVAALRALIEKGAVDRIGVPNTFGDVRYVLRCPQAAYAHAWRASLATVGASVRHLVAA